MIKRRTCSHQFLGWGDGKQEINLEWPYGCGLKPSKSSLVQCNIENVGVAWGWGYAKSTMTIWKASLASQTILWKRWFLPCTLAPQPVLVLLHFDVIFVPPYDLLFIIRLLSLAFCQSQCCSTSSSHSAIYQCFSQKRPKWTWFYREVGVASNINFYT